MKHKKLNNFLLMLFILSALMFTVCFADEAYDITAETRISVQNLIKGNITDNNIATHSKGENVTLSIESEMPLGGIYIKYNKAPNGGILDGTSEIAENGFLHEYICLNGKNSAAIEYDSVDICDIFVYSQGTLPADVQLWQVGEEETDILLCATHSDDDQLFFAGLLPYYARYIGANVRVAYFINHYDTYTRTHELLDGLWHCGVTNYPDISPFPDGYSESVDGAMNYLSSKGISYDDTLLFQKALIEKYRPLVVVLHDFDGEYGHGAHRLNTKSFVEVCENAGENDYVPEKIYVHLYEQNPIILDIDRPLDVFGGRSAFNISQEAFGFHKSQHWTWFYGWIYGKSTKITRADEIKTYNPAEYGLYYSRVGEDINKNDILENIVMYADRKKESDVNVELPVQETEIENNVPVKSKDSVVKDEVKSFVISPYYFLPAIILIIVILCTVLLIKSNKKKR